MGLWQDKTRKHWCYSFQHQKRSYAARGFSTKKEAAAAREDRRKELKNPIKAGMAYSEAVNLYLDHAERAFVKKTYKGKVYCYKSFYTFLKFDFPLQEITTQMIESYLKTRPSNNNYNVHKKDLSALFTYAKEILEVIDKHPIRKIKNLPHTKRKKIMPTEEDVLKLILAADPKTDEKDLLIVLLYTAARIDEILRLTWEDVNFEKMVLTKWTKKTSDGSYKPIRVKINEDLYKTLWKRWNEKEQGTWVFYNPSTETRYNHRPKLMKGLCKRAGIEPYFTFHTLRHLMASLLSDNPKISTSTIQGILGHSEERTTKIYIQEIGDAQKNAMDSISGLFDPKKKKTATKTATTFPQKKESPERLSFFKADLGPIPEYLYHNQTIPEIVGFAPAACKIFLNIPG